MIILDGLLLVECIHAYSTTSLGCNEILQWLYYLLIGNLLYFPRYANALYVARYLSVCPSVSYTPIFYRKG